MKKKTPTKPKEVPKQINDLEEFQSAYGPEWQKITQMPAFRAGLQLLNVRELDKITSLSHDDIEKHGLLIFSELIGLLRHENAMFSLHKESTFQLPTDEEEIYMSPEEQAAHEQLRSKFSEEERKRRYV
jgi:hypothetical protein